MTMVLVLFLSHYDTLILYNDKSYNNSCYNNRGNLWSKDYIETSQRTVMLCKNTIIGKIIRMLYFL